MFETVYDLLTQEFPGNPSITAHRFRPGMWVISWNSHHDADDAREHLATLGIGFKGSLGWVCDTSFAVNDEPGRIAEGLSTFKPYRPEFAF